MSSYSPIGAEMIPQGIAETSTAQRLSLGSIVKANDVASTQYGQGEFIYAAGAASTAVGSLALINPDDWSTSLAVADDKGILGVAMSANPASSYGFYQTKGKAVVKALTGFLDNADCYLTSTAGSIDDAVVAGDFIYGMKGASAVGTPSTGLAEAEINNPSVKNAADVSLADLGITASAAELNANDITAAGTVQASKTVVVDSNKDISAFRNVGLVNLDAGSSGVAGTVDIFPTTASKGKTAFTAADNTGDTTTTIATALQAGAVTYTIPDHGASGSFVLASAFQYKVDAVAFNAAKWVDVTVTAAILDAAGNVPVIAGVAGDQYKVRGVRLVGGGTNFGAGGDRLIDLTDGTTVYTTIANADIESAPAATLEWGNTKVPFLTGTSDTATASAAALRFQYSGGTTDHTTGSIKFSVLIEKVA
jgi:hypothetical protein